MKIVICGSMTNYMRMREIRDELVKYGNNVILPDPSNDEQLKEILKDNYVDTSELKLRFDYIRKHYDHIASAHLIIVANYSKNEIENYIGGNSFLEMGFAYSLGKPIYLVNPIPNIDLYYHEMMAMKPTVLNENFKLFDNDIVIDKAYGGIIFRNKGKKIEVLLVRKHGFISWDLPKGHKSTNELDMEAALREVIEETGYSSITLTNRIITSEFTYSDETSKKVIFKTVDFYIGKSSALISKSRKTLNRDNTHNILESKWVEVGEALKLVSYPPYKNALKKAISELNVELFYGL